MTARTPRPSARARLVDLVIEACAEIADAVDEQVKQPHMVKFGYRPLGVGDEIRKLDRAAVMASGKRAAKGAKR